MIVPHAECVKSAVRAPECPAAINQYHIVYAERLRVTRAQKPGWITVRTHQSGQPTPWRPARPRRPSAPGDVHAGENTSLQAVVTAGVAWSRQEAVRGGNSEPVRNEKGRKL
jgi:hypothetical protein